MVLKKSFKLFYYQELMLKILSFGKVWGLLDPHSIRENFRTYIEKPWIFSNLICVIKQKSWYINISYLNCLCRDEINPSSNKVSQTNSFSQNKIENEIISNSRQHLCSVSYILRLSVSARSSKQNR